MNHDRIHAREPAHDPERYRVGVVRAIEERDGHVVVTVEPAEGADGAAPVELTVTHAVGDLFVDRLDLGDDESPVGERVWYRVRGGRR